ncbi:MAG: hypothetical protein HY562_02185 [Ignavibacteriales bacterium]|nr:hypothetical protein [Ignavibacteriales bacterium]
MMLLWLIGGLIVVSVAFLLPGSHPEVWPNLNVAGLAAGVYILAVIAYTIRSPLTKKARTATWIIAVITVPALGVFWTGMDSTSHWQQRTLLSIRATIGRGIIASEVPDTLLSILDEYHNPKGRGIRKMSLGKIFESRYPRTRVGDNIHIPNSESDSLRVFVSTLLDTIIVLEAQELYVKGRDPSFKNFNGRTGMVEERYILTAKGVNHESRN